MKLDLLLVRGQVTVPGGSSLLMCPGGLVVGACCSQVGIPARYESLVGSNLRFPGGVVRLLQALFGAKLSGVAPGRERGYPLPDALYPLLQRFVPWPFRGACSGQLAAALMCAKLGP